MATTDNEAIKREQSKMLLFAELNAFNEPGNVKEKVKAVNRALNSFLASEGCKNFTDEVFVQNLIFNLTGIVDHLVSTAECWENFKASNPKIIDKINGSVEKNNSVNP